MSVCQTCRPRMCADCPKALQKVNDDILRDRVVIGVLDDETRHKLLAQAGLTLDGAIRICRAEEAAKQTKEGISSSLGVHVVKSTYKRQKSQSKAVASPQKTDHAPTVDGELTQPRRAPLLENDAMDASKWDISNHCVPSSVRPRRHQPSALDS